jgi:DNA-binding NtrC family response regulator
MNKRVLVVDDDPDSCSALKELLSAWGYETAEAFDGEEALERARAFRPALVLSDLIMPGLDGLELLKALRVELPSSAIILLTGNATVESAVAAMKDGAYDYITKPVDIRRLEVLVAKALEKADVMREVTLLRRQLRDTRGIGPLLGSCPAMQRVFRLIRLAASTTAPVLILGESGTGKELVARTIHDLSARRQEPFVAVNCSAIPETLLESELLGHEKGAFTGALKRRAGYFELADRGTLLLDEIAEMSPALQAKYLRVLQDGTVRRVGGDSEIKVDVRILAATNKDPIEAIKTGALREDLYYRLNVFTITLPPLRHRKQDIPVLVDSFISEFSATYEKQVKGIDDAALRTLTEYAWPGNIRELRNCIERAVVACDGDRVGPDMLYTQTPFSSKQAHTDNFDGVVLPVGTTLEQAERELILKTLGSTSDNRTRAAEILGVSAKTIHNKLKQYRLADLRS